MDHHFRLSLSECRVLDLGCGAGRDVYIISALVGPKGESVGLDMTDKLLNVAKENVSEWQKQFTDFKPNIRFINGKLENLEDIEDNSVDVCISNCVVNLCADKAAVLKSVFRVLKSNGELYFSDMYAGSRLPEETRKNEMLIGEGIAGAAYLRDFMKLSKQTGFNDPRIVDWTRLSIASKMQDMVKGLKMFSVTLRLFKNDKLEDSCEDYGDVAVYRGGTDLPEKIIFDKNLVFEKDVETPIDGNTAQILMGSERFKKVFSVKLCTPRRHIGSFCPDGTDSVLHPPQISQNCCKK